MICWTFWADSRQDCLTAPPATPRRRLHARSAPYPTHHADEEGSTSYRRWMREMAGQMADSRAALLAPHPVWTASGRERRTGRAMEAEGRASGDHSGEPVRWVCGYHSSSFVVEGRRGRRGGREEVVASGSSSSCLDSVALGWRSTFR